MAGGDLAEGPEHAFESVALQVVADGENDVQGLGGDWVESGAVR
jgi:hypothetical protein